MFLRGRDKAESWRVTFYLRRRICKRGQGGLREKKRQATAEAKTRKGEERKRKDGQKARAG
jgi:hypothetical protein